MNKPHVLRLTPGNTPPPIGEPMEFPNKKGDFELLGHVKKVKRTKTEILVYVS